MSNISDEFMTQAHIAKLVGVGSATIAKWSRNSVNGFPAPLRIGSNPLVATKRWRKSEIDKWIAKLKGIRNVPFVGGQ